MYENISFLKDELEAVELLEELSEYPVKVSGNRISCLCLNPEHKDRHYGNFYYRTDRNTYICYYCSIQGDTLDLIKMVKGCNFIQALSYLRNFVGASSFSEIDKLEALLKKRQIKDEEIPMDIIDRPVYHRYDFSFAKEHIRDYVFKKRNWSKILLHAYEIGYCEAGHFSNRIIFPIKKSDGSLVSFTARTTVDDRPKYLFPKDAKISELIWGLENKWRTTPIFVEGVTDALRLRQYGFNSFAILGNQLGERKLEFIREEFKEYKEMIIIPDNDEGGNVLLKWFQRFIHDFKVKVGLIGIGKDIDKMDRERVLRLLGAVKNLAKYQIDYFLSNKEKNISITHVHR